MRQSLRSPITGSVIFILFSAVLAGSLAWSEPWISNRFAKNCAACHAPGRVNVAPKKRRCTLSCQGCHVNPNGGGLRNYYGKWTGEYWMRSFESKAWKHNKDYPQPYDKQKYNHKKIEAYLKKLPAKKRREFLKTQADEGIKMRTTKKRMPETAHDRHNATSEKLVQKNWNKVMTRIPKDDPYRLRRERLMTVSGDFRYFYVTGSRNGESYDWSVPMAFDLGARVMPVNKFAFVTEARFLNGPSTTSDRSTFDSQFQNSQVRSAYFIVDDLMYNTYIMKGLYRPLFGYYNIDHRSLTARITGLDHRYVANATTIGGSPNVPFFQIHLIEPTTHAISGTLGKEKGYAANAGGRFITWGASIMFSIWSTEDEISDSKKEMNSLTFGFNEWNLIGNFDLVSYKVTTSERVDQGSYWLMDLKYKLWKELYLTTTMASANTAISLQEGSASESMFGFKFFPLSGLELELLQVERNDTEAAGSETAETATQLQMHYFF